MIMEEHFYDSLEEDNSEDTLTEEYCPLDNSSVTVCSKSRDKTQLHYCSSKSLSDLPIADKSEYHQSVLNKNININESNSSLSESSNEYDISVIVPYYEGDVIIDNGKIKNISSRKSPSFKCFDDKNITKKQPSSTTDIIKPANSSTGKKEAKSYINLFYARNPEKKKHASEIRAMGGKIEIDTGDTYYLDLDRCGKAFKPNRSIPPLKLNKDVNFYSKTTSAINTYSPNNQVVEMSSVSLDKNLKMVKVVGKTKQSSCQSEKMTNWLRRQTYGKMASNKNRIKMKEEKLLKELEQNKYV